MLKIFQYDDYRSFLKDAYEEQRKLDPAFSHRGIGKRGGFDPGLFSKVISGQRNISSKMIPRFVEAFSLGEREAAYFSVLVRLNQARLISQKKKLLDELLRFKMRKVKVVNELQAGFYSEWYHSAVRELLNVYPRATPDFISRIIRPEVSAAKVRKSIDLLIDLGMIKKNKSGEFELCSQMQTTGATFKNIEVNHFLKESIRLSLDVQDRFKSDEYNLSSVSFSISDQRYPELVQRIRDFRKSMMEFIEEDKQAERAYQMNIQLFPLAIKKSDKAEEL
jgi:uncharacterized protein (TIGR02147 family)